jgi:hypothetical protein
MGSFVGLSNRIYLAQLDLSGLANEVTFGPITTAMRPFTTFNEGGYNAVKPGLTSGAAMVKGFQDYAVDVLDDDISIGQLGSQYPFTVVANPTGTVTAADTCWLSRGLVSDLKPFDGAKGDPAAFELGLAYDAAIVQAKVGAPLAAVTANGTGTAVLLTGPTAAQKLYGALHVTAYSGFTNVVFTIESDDNSGFSSPTTRTTFATVTGRTSEFASVAGAFSSETYHRVKWVVTGSGSVTFVATFGVI